MTRDAFDSDPGLDGALWTAPGSLLVHAGDCHTPPMSARPWSPDVAGDFDTPCPVGLPDGLPEG